MAADRRCREPVLARVRELVVPIASDLGLDALRLEQRGGTLRITLDTPPARRAESPSTPWLWPAGWCPGARSPRPGPGHYTLEVSSPGVERTLRTPAHFRRGRQGRRRSVWPTSATTIAGSAALLVAADDTTATVTVDPGGPAERTVRYDQIDRAKTVFEWPAAKPPSRRGAARGRARPPQEAQEGAVVVSNLDMTEAIRLLAQEKGLSRTRCCTCSSTPLASAYKRRPGAADEVVVEVDPQTMEFTFIGLRPRRGRQLGQRARRHAARTSSAASPPRRSAR